MKLKTFVVILMSLLFASQASADLWVKFYTDGPGTTGGGAFTAKVISADPVGMYEQGETFYTFCLERNEYISNEAMTKVELNVEAIKGGLNNEGTSIESDPLDFRSAWIYTEYMKANHGSIGAETGLIGEDNIANVVQYALWTIEEEANYSTYMGGAVQDLIDAAADANWDDIGDVRVLNVFNIDSTGAMVYRQDMLVMTPIPATILIGLLGLGVGGWRLRKTM